eukprot:CAMPEP_0182427716 /NCGR_PEP_ID=MMETSP1167-20130531/19007_1 /TAXON_ID=2988 /ORGANISM="Mallomonas Sp, Strain CCMP3275" /LENGTH=309 /DNA_ID=CAMNT_0024610155 /DNA_START=157 /DNA_END=1087 /DNA_ORIENTATION=+
MIFDAIEFEDLDLLAHALEVDPESIEIVEEASDHFSPLSMACRQPFRAAVSYLISCGANINARDINEETPLFAAVATDGADALFTNADIEIVKILISEGADVNTQNKKLYTPLMLACRYGRRDIALLLLENGARVEMTDNEGDTALSSAAFWKKISCIQSLVTEYHADVNTVNDAGITPLMWACHRGHADLAALLVSYGANIYAKNNEEDTVLMIACSQRGNTEFVKYLLQQQIDVNTQNLNGRTALHFAVTKKGLQCGLVDVAVALISNGADVFIRDKKGKTPLENVIDEFIIELREHMHDGLFYYSV